MKPVEPSTPHIGATIVVFAKNQPPYIPLPASVDAQGTVMTEWELSEEERAAIMGGARIRLWVLFTGVMDTPAQPLTPVMIEVVS